ncbi:unnamed protein product [Rhizoctonia solani]|uniref:Uncharacterized protein n=1 Tax=Rhizoctonia solani TaxID=456999 RepID=A0A8H3DTV9_9AGAM|nr:unnamed protein product [Rhizoctonia solani]
MIELQINYTSVSREEVGILLDSSVGAGLAASSDPREPTRKASGGREATASTSFLSRQTVNSSIRTRLLTAFSRRAPKNQSRPHSVSSPHTIKLRLAPSHRDPELYWLLASSHREDVALHVTSPVSDTLNPTLDVNATYRVGAYKASSQPAT